MQVRLKDCIGFLALSCS